MLCLEQPTETAHLFTGTTTERAAIEAQEDADAAYQPIERDYANADYVAFCQQARACAVVPLSDAELIRAYARHTYSQNAADEHDEWAERDRLERAEEIANEAVAYTSGIPAHVAFDSLHKLVKSFSHKWQRSRLEIELTADLYLAAKFATRNDLTAWAFYCLWSDGKADDVPAHALTRSDIWFRLRSLVGNEIVRRRLLCGYFKKRRNGRAR